MSDLVRKEKKNNSFLVMRLTHDGGVLQFEMGGFMVQKMPP